MDFTINIDALDKTQAVVTSTGDRTPVSDFELLVVGNRVTATVRFCDDSGATPAFVMDATVVVELGLGYPAVNGSLDYASVTSLSISGSTRTGTLDLDSAALKTAVYNAIYGSPNNLRLAQAPFVLEVRTTTAAGLVQTRCLQRVFVSFRVLPLVLDANPNPGLLAVLYDPSTGLLARPLVIPVLSGGVPAGGAINYVLSKASASDYDLTWVAQTGGGGGGVSSVAMSVPSFLSVAGSPITSSGTLAVTLQTQAANIVFGGPTTGSAAVPTFRSLVAADIPSLTLAKVSDAGTLASLNAAPAGTLTGTTLASNVVTSSLTALGTIATGVWNGTAITDTYISSAATWNAKQAAITFGTGVLASLANNIGSAGAPVLFNGAGGTPSSLVGTNITGTAAGLTAGAATVLATARAINGVNFDGSAAITVTAAAGTLTGATLAANVLASSLTSVGTIATGVWQGTAIAAAYVATLNQNTTGSAASLSISGQTGLLTVTGLASTNRIKTVRDAADTILELGGSYTPTGTWTSMTLVAPALGTPISGNGSNLSGIVISITGTANQVVASGSTGSITLSLPQSIATTSTPRFANLGLGAAASAKYGVYIGSVLTTGNTAGVYSTPLLQASANSDSLYGIVSLPGVDKNGATGLSAYGLFVLVDSGNVIGSGTITTAYGISIANVTMGSTTNYAIKTGSGLIAIGDTTEATTGAVGSIVTLGGIYSTKAIISGSATDATTTGTGSIITAGGVGIAKALWVGGLANIAGALAVTGHVTLEGVTSTGATGTGLLVFGTSPTLVTPVLGTPSSGNLSNCTALPASSLTAGILGANITLGESTGQIILDPALSADGTWSGIMQAGTAGATLAFGDLVYFQVSDSRWELTDADAEATSGPLLLGMCVLAAAADGSATNILLYGKIRADAKFPTLTIGAPAYVGTTAGEIQVAQPSGTDDVIRVAGWAITADSILFAPDPSWMTHT